jgi:hypothetical protein
VVVDVTGGQAEGRGAETMRELVGRQAAARASPVEDGARIAAAFREARDESG